MTDPSRGIHALADAGAARRHTTTLDIVEDMS